MERLTIKELAPYLPYGLKVLFNNKVDTFVNFINNDSGLWLSDRKGDYYNGLKPLLRPLSFLTEEIEHNGEKFVPLIELAKIATLSHDSPTWSVDDNNYRVYHVTGAQFYFSSDKSFVYKNSDEWKDFGTASSQLELFNKLHQWHFDVFGLIDRGLALPIDGKEVEG